MGRVSVGKVSAVLARRIASREYIESRAMLFSRNKFEPALNEISGWDLRTRIASESPI